MEERKQFVLGRVFQSTRLSRASTGQWGSVSTNIIISIHKALASLDQCIPGIVNLRGISIHKALASLDHKLRQRQLLILRFQSTRLSRASTLFGFWYVHVCRFQSTRLSRASTWERKPLSLAQVEFQSTRLSRASTAKLSNNPSTSP